MKFDIIIPIVRKEFRQIRRDKRTLGVLLFIPALMLLMFGYALNFDVKHTSLAVYDEDRSSASREFARQFWNSEFFDLKFTLEDAREADQLLDGEQVRVVLIIPASFSERLARGQEATVQVLIDGTSSFSASSILGYINGILIPGLIAFILMIVAVVSTALAVVRERELGTMEQIMVAPIRPSELILGKTIPYTLLSLIATVTILVAGYILFNVHIKGSVFLLFIVTVVFLLGSLGLGLLISTIAQTQQVAFMIAVIATMLPTFILSGFVFPIRNMPGVVQAITYLIPARYFLVALRSIILKGAGLSAFWDQFLFLILYAILSLTVSSARLRKLLH